MALIDKVESDIISQYLDSLILIDFIKAFLAEADTLNNEIIKVLNDRKLNNAYGVQLDIIGNIIGAKREVVDFTAIEFFGYSPDPTALEFENVVTPNPNAGRYISATEPEGVIRKLSDSEYLILINATIEKNTSDVTPDDVLSITRKMLNLMYPLSPDVDLILVETGNASFSLEIFYAVSVAEQAFIFALNLIPRPAGIGLTLIYTP